MKRGKLQKRRGKGGRASVELKRRFPTQHSLPQVLAVQILKVRCPKPEGQQERERKSHVRVCDTLVSALEDIMQTECIRERESKAT
mmetsp:Transcript_21559/g.42839  ORF Transcript_21559/g.42839 Transcript_21559/m.42839 type:complete len:86 (+) Transcript_21559:1257-1514(+)